MLTSYPMQVDSRESSNGYCRWKFALDSARQRSCRLRIGEAENPSDPRIIIIAFNCCRPFRRYDRWHVRTKIRLHFTAIRGQSATRSARESLLSRPKRTVFLLDGPRASVYSPELSSDQFPRFFSSVPLFLCSSVLLFLQPPASSLQPSAQPTPSSSFFRFPSFFPVILVL